MYNNACKTFLDYGGNILWEITFWKLNLFPFAGAGVEKG
jgi:hypothetical protein